MNEPTILDSITAALVTGSYAMILLAAALTFVRVVRGPGVGDRVVGLDLLAVLLIAFIGVHAVGSNDDRPLDVAVSVALVTFLATVAFARLVGIRRPPPGNAPPPSETPVKTREDSQ